MTHLATQNVLTAEQRLDVLESVHDALLVTDTYGAAIYMNDAARHLYGFEEPTGDELESLDLERYVLENFELCTPNGDPVENDDRPLVRALRGEAFRDVELHVTPKEDEDGSDSNTRVFVFSGRRIDGDPPLGVLTIRDETERWRAERRYRVAFETDPAPSVVARLEDGEILQANTGMLEMTEIDKRNLIGQALGDLDLLARNGDLDEALDALKQGKRIHKLKSELNDATGNAIDVLLSARAIELDGDACGIFTFLEISDLERSRREHQAAQRELTHARGRLAEQREQERVRLARDLHDTVLQSLLASTAELALAEQRYRDAGADVAADASRRSREQALHTAAELRRLIRGFRPSALRDVGLWDSLRETLPDAAELGGPEIVLPAGRGPDLPDGTLLVLYRVAREAVFNALRHARAKRVEVTFQRSEEVVVLRVEDDGEGFEVPSRLSQLERTDHFGLIGMEERANAQGGTLEVESAPGEGTRVVCRLPLDSTGD